MTVSPRRLITRIGRLESKRAVPMYHVLRRGYALFGIETRAGRLRYGVEAHRQTRSPCICMKMCVDMHMGSDQKACERVSECECAGLLTALDGYRRCMHKYSQKCETIRTCMPGGSSCGKISWPFACSLAEQPAYVHEDWRRDV